MSEKFLINSTDFQRIEHALKQILDSVSLLGKTQNAFYPEMLESMSISDCIRNYDQDSRDSAQTLRQIRFEDSTSLTELSHKIICFRLYLLLSRQNPEEMVNAEPILISFSQLKSNFYFRFYTLSREEKQAGIYISEKELSSIINEILRDHGSTLVKRKGVALQLLEIEL